MFLIIDGSSGRLVPEGYLDVLLEKTAQLCIKEANWSKGILAADSSGVETDRYETVIRPNRKKKRFEEVRRLFYLKYHIVAILDHLIILKARVTSYRSSDCRTLKSMLGSLVALQGASSMLTRDSTPSTISSASTSF